MPDAAPPALRSGPRLGFGGRRPASLTPALMLSAALHIAAALAIALRLVDLVPRLHEAAVQPATVELVMSPPGSDRNGTPEPASEEAEQPTPAAPATVSAPTPPPPSKEAETEPPTPEPQVKREPQVQPAPAQRAEQKPMQFSLGDIESDTNALVRGDIVVPPRPDIKFHNRKPSYPREAALRGEQGAVLLIIHVAPDGTVSMVDIAESSGFRRLDNAAREAVETWHFTPAMHDGQTVSFDVTMRIVFNLY